MLAKNYNSYSEMSDVNKKIIVPLSIGVHTLTKLNALFVLSYHAMDDAAFGKQLKCSKGALLTARNPVNVYRAYRTTKIPVNVYHSYH